MQYVTVHSAVCHGVMSGQDTLSWLFLQLKPYFKTKQDHKCALSNGAASNATSYPTWLHLCNFLSVTSTQLRQSECVTQKKELWLPGSGRYVGQIYQPKAETRHFHNILQEKKCQQYMWQMSGIKPAVSTWSCLLSSWSYRGFTRFLNSLKFHLPTRLSLSWCQHERHH